VLDKYTVEKLKALAAAQGWKHGGKKSKIVERIVIGYREFQASPEKAFRAALSSRAGPAIKSQKVSWKNRTTGSTEITETALPSMMRDLYKGNFGMVDHADQDWFDECALHR
jgi:hypothetical protein